MDRWGRLRNMDTTAQLKRMMDKAAEFRGVQKEARCRRRVLDAYLDGREGREGCEEGGGEV
jgi:hypothetical protein